MDCTKLTSKCPEVNNCCLLHLEKTVKYAAALLEEFQISYWIDYNTLRGALDNGVFAEENALSFYNEDFAKIQALAHRIYEDGYFLSNMRMGKNIWLRLHYSHSNLLGVDLLNWYTVKNILFRRSPYNGRHCKFDRKYVSTTSSISFGGISMKCPPDPAEFVKFRYGE